MVQSVAIVGAGASGTMLAVQLLRRTACSVTLIERGKAFGRGVAYGAAWDAHLLNVRSGRMSMTPACPGDFVDWLAENSPDEADPDGFARRSTYGRYLEARLAEAERDAPGRLARVTGEAVALDAQGVRLADGRTARGDIVVLATGNLPPEPMRFRGAEMLGEALIGDPWAPGALEAIGKDEDVLLIGTGLTAVDVLLALDSKGWRGRALALSRRGLLPRSHEPHGHAVAGRRPQTGAAPSRALRAFRREAEADGWGEAMERVRPFVSDLWRGATAQERARFLRHLRPWWDVHRHRTAWHVGETVRRMMEDGRAEIAAGRLRSAEPDGGRVRVCWSPRGADEPATKLFDRLVVCTGPAFDLQRTADPLLGGLFREGRARVDPLRLGLDVEDDGRVRDAQGRADPRLFAMGPLTRAAFWEIVAVPDIREQALKLADRLGALARRDTEVGATA